MASLELKVPPVLLVLFFAALMWITALIVPGIEMPSTLRYVAAGIMVVTGACFSIAGVVYFKKARTTVNPVSPQNSTCLVTGGVYSVTRNPMYAGFLLFLAGWAILLSNLYSAVFLVGFIVYMNRFQIIPEEKALQTLFDGHYENYKNRVPRWF